MSLRETPAVVARAAMAFFIPGGTLCPWFHQGSILISYDDIDSLLTGLYVAGYCPPGSERNCGALSKKLRAANAKGGNKHLLPLPKGLFLSCPRIFLPEKAPLVLNFVNAYFFDLGKRYGKVHTAGVLTLNFVPTGLFLAYFSRALSFRSRRALLLNAFHPFAHPFLSGWTVEALAGLPLGFGRDDCALLQMTGAGSCP